MKVTAAPELRFADPMNAATLFVDRNVEEGRGDRVAILCQDKEFTFRQVQEMVNRTGNVLLGLGVQPEQRVMMLLLDGPEFVATFFGAIKTGAVPVPINTNLRPADYKFYLNDSRSSVAVVSQSLVGQLEPVLGELRYLRHLVVVDGAGESSSGPINRHRYADLLAVASGDLAAEPRSPDDMCFWLYSSGTTGSPKGAVHLQHDMIVSSELYARSILNISEGDRCFSVAKLYFAYGLGNALYFPFWVGASAVLDPGRPEPRRVFETI